MLSYKVKVNRKIFVSEDTGFGVFRVTIDGSRESRVIVGNLFSLSEGDFLQIEGEESEHPRFGKQIKVSRFEFIKPQDGEGIARYLSSGPLQRHRQENGPEDRRPLRPAYLRRAGEHSGTAARGPGPE